MAASAKKQVDTRVTVETPEGVDFQYVIAGPGKRGIALLCDILIRIAVLVICGWIIGMLGIVASSFFGEMSGQAAGFMLILWFALSWLYSALFETFMRGQTPGKRMLGLRVLRSNGTPVSWFEAFGRNLLHVADGWVGIGPIGLNTVGVISMTMTSRMQRLGDIFFDTMVVDEERSFVSRAAGLTEGIDRIPRDECTGRYHVPERTLAIVERLFDGDRIIPPLRREEIARPLAAAIRERLGWEEPGPNLENPHQFFEQVPHRHSTFLRRVLKTFAEDESGAGNGSDRSERKIRIPEPSVVDPEAARVPARIVAAAATEVADEASEVPS